MCIRDRLYKVNTNFSDQSRPVHAELNFYTDGSKMQNKVGSGFVAIKQNNVVSTRSFRLPDYCTVFQAEIMAILQAAKFMNENGRTEKYIRFYVDSSCTARA